MDMPLQSSGRAEWHACAREPVLRIAALHKDNFSRSQVDTPTGPEVVLCTAVLRCRWR